MPATAKHPSTKRATAPRHFKPGKPTRKGTVTSRAKAAPAPKAAADGFVERRLVHPQRRAIDRIQLDPAKLQAGIMQAIAGAVVRPAGAEAPVPPATAVAAPVAPPVAAPEGLQPGTVRNGLRYPDTGTVTERLWTLYSAAPEGLTVAGARELAKKARLNEHSAVIAFYNWRKFYKLQ